MSPQAVVVLVALCFATLSASDQTTPQCGAPTSWQISQLEAAYVGSDLNTPPLMCGDTLSSPCHDLSSSIWIPEKDHFQLQTTNEVERIERAPSDWWRLIDEEMYRSLDASRTKVESREEAWEEMVKFADRHNKPMHIVIFENRLFVHKAFREKSKNINQAALIRSAILQDPELFKKGGVIFNINVDVKTVKFDNPGTTFTVKQQKKFGYPECGVLIPNSYFTDLDKWEDLYKSIQETSLQNPWETRLRQAFWRGSFHAKKQMPCHLYFGNYARWQAVTLNFTSDLVATGCLKGCKFVPQCVGVPPIPTPDSTMMEVRNHIRDFQVPMIDLKDFSQYRYLLNLPGALAGSYTKGLNNLWATGGIVLLWNAPYVEWYFPALSHGNTHLSVTYNSLVPTLEWLERNPEEVARLREGAKQVQEMLLCKECLGNYTRRMLKATQEHFGMDLILNDREQARKFFKENYECDKWLEFTHGNKLLRLPNSEHPLCPDE